MSEASQRDVKKMWTAYRRAGGGNPSLFVGIKSYRLYYWSNLPQLPSVIRLALRLFRMLWRWYTFVPLVCAFTITVTLTQVRLSAGGSIGLRVVAFAVCAGALCIGVEALLSRVVLKGWATLYHRWPSPGKSQGRIRDIGLFVYSGLLALLSGFTLILVLMQQTGLFGAGKHLSNGEAVRRAVVDAFGGLISNVASDPSLASATNLGLGATLMIGLMYLVYFPFGLAVLLGK